MRKIITVLIMLIATAFTVSAEMVRYNVKYQSKYDLTMTTWYDVDTEMERIDRKVELFDWLNQVYDLSEIIDGDSDAEDLAIVNKLDKQGLEIAFKLEWGDWRTYAKINGTWHKFCGLHSDELSKE